MLFRYRHVLAVLFALIILLAGYCFDLRELQENNIDLIASENELRQPAASSQTKPLNDRSNDKRLTAAVNLQSEFLSLAAANQVIMESINKVDVPPNAPINDEYYQLSIISNYQGLIGFLRRMNELSSHLLLRRISIQTKLQGQLQTDIILRASTTSINQRNTSSVNFNNPFCESANRIVERQEQTDQLQLFELSKITMLGTINLAGKTSAILLFPNGVIKEVTSKMKLGIEQGVIADILPDKILLNLPSHQSYQLKME